MSLRESVEQVSDTLSGLPSIPTARIDPLFRLALKDPGGRAVEAIVRRGIDVNSRDQRGQTPLMIAAAFGNLVACRVLLAAGADVSAVDEQGRDAGAHAKASQHPDLCRLLADHEVISKASEAPRVADEVAEKAVDVQPPLQLAEDDAADDGFGSSVWIATPTPNRPEEDPQDAAAHAMGQIRVSLGRARFEGATWSDVGVDLPRARPKSEIDAAEAALDPDHLRDISQLATKALALGRISGIEVDGVAAGYSDPERAPMLADAIRTALSDLGVLIDDDQTEFVEPHSVMSGGDADDYEVSLVVEAAQASLSSETRDWKVYLKDVARFPRLTSEDEEALGLSIREGAKEALGIVAQCSAAIAEILTIGRKAIAGECSVGDLMSDPEAVATALVERLELGYSATQGYLAIALSFLSAKLDAIQALHFAAEPTTAGVLRPDLARAVRRHLIEIDPPLALLERLSGLQGNGPLECGMLHALGAAIRKVNASRERMVVSNLRLVVWQARRYSRASLDKADLVQEGTLGLIKAATKFDPHRGFKFATYAVWWVRQAMSRATADLGRTIRVPVHLWERLRRLERLIDAAPLDSEIAPADLAKTLELDEESVRKLMRVPGEPVPIDTILPEEIRGQAPWNFGGVPSPEDDCVAASLRRTVNAALKTLTKKQSDILSLRDGLDRGDEQTLEQVGIRYGVTRERIRQIEAKAMRRLGYPARSRALADFL